MNRIVASIIALLVMLSACDEDSTGPSGSTSSPFDQTPRENFEAESMALYVSGELTAPQVLYDAIERELDEIRTSWPDSVPDVQQTTFLPPWMPGELLVRLTEEASKRYREGTFDDLDELHEQYRLVEEDSIFYYQDKLWVHYRFEGRLHPQRLAEAYRVFTSVGIAEPNGMWNNQQNVYPWTYAGGRTYLFRWGWGDCPAGCIRNRFSYFRMHKETSEWVGSFVRYDDPEPGWWAEARAGWACYHGRDECPVPVQTH